MNLNVSISLYFPLSLSFLNFLISSFPYLFLSLSLPILISSSPYLFLTLSLPLLISSYPYLFLTLSLPLLISSSPYLFLTLSLPHLVYFHISTFTFPPLFLSLSISNFLPTNLISNFLLFLNHFPICPFPFNPITLFICLYSLSLSHLTIFIPYTFLPFPSHSILPSSQLLI